MKIIQSILTNNDCYKAGKKIKVKGLMIHSVGCSQPNASVFIKQWDKSGIEKGVHGFIEPDGDIFQTLPWGHRGWHAGGTANNTHMGFEMTEPATIKYKDNSSEWIDLDPVNTKKHVLSTYIVAVELFAQLCKEFKLDPLADGVIISHNEGYKRRIASGHADVEHMWNKFGLTMDKFRKDINMRLKATSEVSAPIVSTAPKPVAKTYIVKSGDSLSRIAVANKTTVAALVKLNGIKNPSLISIGQIIKLP